MTHERPPPSRRLTRSIRRQLHPRRVVVVELLSFLGPALRVAVAEIHDRGGVGGRLTEDLLRACAAADRVARSRTRPDWPRRDSSPPALHAGLHPSARIPERVLCCRQRLNCRVDGVYDLPPAVFVLLIWYAKS